MCIYINTAKQRGIFIVKKFVDFLKEQQDNVVHLPSPSQLAFQRRVDKGMQKLKANRSIPPPDVGLLPLGTRVRIHGNPTSGTVHFYPQDTTSNVEGYTIHQVRDSHSGTYVTHHLLQSPHVDGVITGHDIVDRDMGKPSHVYVVKVDNKHNEDALISHWATKPYKRKDGTRAPNANLTHVDNDLPFAHNNIQKQFVNGEVTIRAVKSPNKISVLSPTLTKG
jgi:hypothetical protein